MKRNYLGLFILLLSGFLFASQVSAQDLGVTIYSENFDGCTAGVEPDCWTTSGSAATGTRWYINNSTAACTINGKTLSQSNVTNTGVVTITNVCQYGENAVDLLAYGAAFDAESWENLTFQFDWKGTAEGGSFDFAKAVYSFDGTTFVEVPNGPIIANGNSSENLDFSVADGEDFVYVGFSWTQDGVTDGSLFGPIAIDNIIIKGDCALPLPALTLTSGTASFCSGNAAVLESTVNPDGGYQWYKDGAEIAGATGQSFTATETGDYHVEFDGRVCNKESAPFTITVLPSPADPVVTPAGPVEICDDGTSTVTLSVSQEDSYQWFKDGTAAINGNSQTFVVSTSGTYNVQVTNADGCSKFSDDVIVSLKPAANKPIISSQDGNEVCAGDQLELFSSESVGLQWFKDGTLIPGATNQTYFATDAGSYTVKSQPQGGCSATSDPFVVTLATGPAKPSISPNNSPVTTCQGQPVFFTASPADAYQWVLNGNPIQGATLQSYMANFAGTYSVIVYTNGLDCGTESDQVEVIFNPRPQPTITANGATTFCQGGSVLLSSTPGDNYQWYRNGAAISGQIGQTYTATTSGNYYVIVTNSFGCQGTSNSITVTTNNSPPKPAIVPGGLVSICEGQTRTLNAPNGFTYQWFQDGLPLQGETNRTYVVSTSGFYTVQVTNNSGCSNTSDPTEVRVNPIPAKPTITSSGSTGICKGESVTLTSSSASVYQWYKDGVALQNENNRDYVATQSGSYSVAVTSGAGCSAESDPTVVTVFVSDKPAVTPSGPIDYCSNTTATLVSSYTEGNQWYLDGVLLGGETNDTIEASAPGNYKTIVTISGCVDSSAAVVVNELPAPAKPDITPNVADTARCAGQTVQFTTTASLPKQWLKDGQPISGATNSTLIVGNSGVYSVQVTAANGCTEVSDEVNVTIHWETPAAVVEGNQTICSNEFATFTANFDGADSYQWFRDGVAIAGETGSSITTNIGGSYYFEATVDGCFDDSNPVTLTIDQAPNGTTITPSSNGAVCVGEEVTLQSSSATTYQWVRNDAVINGATNQTYSTAMIGDYTVIITNAAGCFDTSDVYTISNQPQPLIDTVDIVKPARCVGVPDGKIEIFTQGGVAPFTYSIDGITFFSSKEFNNLDAGNYKAYLKDFNGCTDTMDFVIEYESDNLAANSTLFKPVTCAGDADAIIKVAASGGSGGYQYNLVGEAPQSSPTFDSLAAGTYEFEVKDQNGCFVSAGTVVVPNPDPLTFTTNIDQQMSCSDADDGIIRGIPVGGVGPYQYSIDGGNVYQTSNLFTNLTEGVYRLRVRDKNGCIKVAPRNDTIINPREIELLSVIKVADARCFGEASGEIHVYAIGGFNDSLEYSADGVNWQWQDSILRVPGGAYTVQVRDPHGCVKVHSEQIVVNEPQELQATVNVANHVQCFGEADGKVIVQATGGTPPLRYSIDGVNFQSSPVLENLPSGFLNVFVEDTNLCQVIAGTFIFQPQPFSANAQTIQNISCFGAADGRVGAQATGGTGAKTYSIDGGATYQTTPLFSDLGPGVYTVMIKDKNDCIAEAPPVFVTQPPQLFASTAAQNVSCFGADDAFLNITAVGGSGVFEYSIDGGSTFTTQNNYPSIAPGTYSVVVRDDTGCEIEDGFYTITEPTELVASVVVDFNETCPNAADGQITSFVSGGTPPYTFMINGGKPQVDNGVYDSLSAGGYEITVMDASGCVDTLDSAFVTRPNAVSLDSIYFTGISCNGAVDGLIEILASGGENGNLSYSIDGVNYSQDSLFTNLSAGNYIVSVRDEDNGCVTLPQTITIVEPGVLAVNPQVLNHVSCNGLQDGRLEAVISGGTAPFTYSLSGGGSPQLNPVFTGLPAGNYSINVVDANGCTASSGSINIVNPPALSITAVLSQVITCNGADDAVIVANGQGGTGALQYIINNGPPQSNTNFGGLAPGIYQVSVIDANGCIQNAPPITIQNPPVLNFSAVVDNHVKCFGDNNGKITVTAFGGVGQKNYSKDGVAYQANPVFNNLAVGTYPISVKDANGCIHDTLITITQPNQLQVTGVVTDENFGQQNGAINITVTGGTAPYTYNWTTGQTTQDIDSLTGSVSGSVYTVTVTDTNGCTAIYSDQVYVQGIGIEENAFNNISVYPNPARSMVNLDFDQLTEELEVKIYNPLGEQVWKDEILKGIDRRTIDVSTWSKGIYMIRFISEEKVKVETLIIQ